MAALGKLFLTALFSLPALLALTALILYSVWIITRRWSARKMFGSYVYSMTDYDYPIIGNALKLMTIGNTTNLWNFVTDTTLKHREGVVFWVFHLNWLFIQELDVVEKILTHQEALDKSYVYSLLDTITEGIFNSNGMKWRKLRKKLNSTFSQKLIDSYSDIVNEQTEVFVHQLEKNTDKFINVQSFVANYFVDVVFRTHFGVETEEQIQRAQTIAEKASRMIEITMEKRFFNVFYHPNWIFYFSPAYKFIEHHRTAALEYIRWACKTRMDVVDIEKDKGIFDDKRKIYVDMVREYLEENKIKATPYRMERNTGDIVVAASDTTSVAVSAALYFLSIYPEIQEKVYEEVLPIFGEERTKWFTKEDLSKMTYLEMVIKETLRMTAPPGIVRDLKTDIDVGKYVIPKGCNVFVAMKAIHENPDYWDTPHDFNPDHFLPEKVSKRPKYAFIPFSSGPRNCPGMVFSYVTMKTAISSVIRNFKLSTDIPLKNIVYKMSIMQEFENGFSIKLTRRP